MNGAEAMEREFRTRHARRVVLEEALEDLRQAAEWRVQADVAYKMGLDHCYELGLSNAQIGKALGISEAAVRMARKRNRDGVVTKMTRPPERE